MWLINRDRIDDDIWLRSDFPIRAISQWFILLLLLTSFNQSGGYEWVVLCIRGNWTVWWMELLLFSIYKWITLFILIILHFFSSLSFSTKEVEMEMKINWAPPCILLTNHAKRWPVGSPFSILKFKPVQSSCIWMSNGNIECGDLTNTTTKASMFISHISTAKWSLFATNYQV